MSPGGRNNELLSFYPPNVTSPSRCVSVPNALTFRYCGSVVLVGLITHAKGCWLLSVFESLIFFITKYECIYEKKRSESPDNKCIAFWNALRGSKGDPLTLWGLVGWRSCKVHPTGLCVFNVAGPPPPSKNALH